MTSKLYTRIYRLLDILEMNFFGALYTPVRAKRVTAIKKVNKAMTVNVLKKKLSKRSRARQLGLLEGRSICNQKVKIVISQECINLIYLIIGVC